ncbi:MAG: periplasmic heavy metal sensor [Paracoccaceae bacterium]
MTETGIENNKGGCPRWMKLALIVSLMLNVAVVGIYAGFSMQDKRTGESGNRQVDWILRLVPEDRRDFTKAQFGEVRDQLRSLREERRAKLDEIVSTVRTEPFDADALSVVLEGRRGANLQTKALVHERLIELMAEFSPAERAVFAERLEERVTRWRERRGN